MKTLAINSEVIRMEQFVECLLDVGNPVTEKSTMRLEALHLETRTRLEESLEDLTQYVQVMKESHPSQDADVRQLQHSVDALNGKLEQMDQRVAARDARDDAMRADLMRLQGSVDLLHQRLDKMFRAS